MKLLRSILLAAVMALFTVAAVASAQNDQGRICGDLSAEDCSTLETAAENMAALNSGSVTANLTITSSESGEPQTTTIDLNGTWSGAGVDLLGMSTNMESVTAGQDLTAIFDALSTGIQGFNGSLELTVTAPEGSTDMPSNLDLELRLVDEIGYINFDRLQESLGDSAQGMNLPSGWGGTNLVDLIEQLGPMLGSMMSSTGAMANATPMAGATPDATDTSTDASRLIELFNRHLTVTRTGTSFEFVVDVEALLNDPDYADYLNEVGGDAMTDEEIANAEGSTINVVVTLTDDEQYVDTIDLDVTNADGEASMTITGPITFGDFEAAETVTAPEDASVVTTDELLQGLGGAMGSN